MFPNIFLNTQICESPNVFEFIGCWLLSMASVLCMPILQYVAGWWEGSKVYNSKSRNVEMGKYTRKEHLGKLQKCTIWQRGNSIGIKLYIFICLWVIQIIQTNNYIIAYAGSIRVICCFQPKWKKSNFIMTLAKKNGQMDNYCHLLKIYPNY